MALEPGRTGFLDLSAEIRNLIYEETLTHNHHIGQLANTALLRVCKQVNKEAKGLCHARSTFTITAECHPPVELIYHFGNRDKPLLLTVFGDIVIPNTDSSTLSTFASAFPLAMESVSSIHLTVIMPMTIVVAEEYRILHHFLYGFASLLAPQSSTVCRSLPVTVDNKARFTASYWEKVTLWPLSKVSSSATLLLIGLCEEAKHEIQNLRLHRSIHELQFNTIRTWKQIEGLVKRRLTDSTELDLVYISKTNLLRAARSVASYLESESEWSQPYIDHCRQRDLALLRKWIHLRQELMQTWDIEIELSAFQCEFHKFARFGVL